MVDLRQIKKIFNSQYALAFYILAIVSSLTISLLYLHFFDRFDWMVYDSFAKQIRMDKTASNDVAVVLIDEASLEALNPIAGRWPWPREIYSDLLDFFNFAPPKMVLFDILFTEKGIDSKLKLSKNDKALVDATRQAGYVYHAMQLLKDNEDEYNKGLLNRPLPKDFKKKFTLASKGGAKWVYSINNNYYLPYDELYRASKGVAVVEYSPDADGIFRHTKPLREYQGDILPIMGLAPFTSDHETIVINKKSVRIGGKEIPVDEDGKTAVNIYGKFNTFSISGIFASLQKIKEGDFENLMVDPAEFEGKIVYIGSSAVGVEDLKATQMSSRTPGVFLHAALASNYLLNDFLKPASNGEVARIVLLLAFMSVFGIYISSHYLLKFASQVLIVAVYLYFCYVSFGANQLEPVIPPIFAVFISSLIYFGVLLFTEWKEKGDVKKMFSQYVSEEALEEISQHYEDYGSLVMGREEDITVLFTDIRSFTTFSDNHTAEVVVKMLNVYFSRMSGVILDGKGTIDKFIGDAIMAYWGAPIKLENHAEMAVITAIKMREELKEINKEIQKLGINHEIKIGIGVNSGTAIIGNIGSEKKLSYTVIGDTVNLASRLEGITKNFGTPILVSEFTQQRISEEIPCRAIDRVAVRGKKDKIKIYEILSHHDGSSKKLADDTNRAYEYFEKEDYATALKLYEELADGDFKNIFIEKCKAKLLESGGSGTEV